MNPALFILGICTAVLLVGYAAARLADWLDK